MAYLLTYTTVIYPLLIRPQIRQVWRILRMEECAACHYDLTGNLSGTCPECGTLISEGAVPEFRKFCKTPQRYTESLSRIRQEKEASASSGSK